MIKALALSGIVAVEAYGAALAPVSARVAAPTMSAADGMYAA